MTSVYYNEIEPYCAQWLRNLMDADLVPRGDIDTRSIEDVRPNELRGYTQCHFFAGLGGWPLALALAGWPSSWPVWTGSCPCQPFSAAGKGAGFADERHLWPAWQHLIAQCNPPIIFGEQVTKAADWLALVCGDLENLAYAVGFNHIEAASAGADHRRDRIFFVADTCGAGLAQRERERGVLREVGSEFQGQDTADDGGSLGDANSAYGQRGAGSIPGTQAPVSREDGPLHGHLANGPQHAGEGGWIIGHDGKARRIPEPSVRLLADGPAAGMAELRAIEERALQEVIEYGKTSQTNPREVLRMVRQIVRTEAGWQRQSTGVCIELSSPEVLLDFLLCIESALEATDGRSIAKALEKTQLRIVRSVWKHGGNGGSPCEWQSTRQHADESTNALLALSFVLARHAKAYQQEASATHAALNRIGMLRALGNAIDPRPAAAFITAYMQARGLIADQQAVAA